MTTTAADILRVKGTNVFAVHPSTRVIDAVSAMNRYRVGCLLVTDGGPLRGLVSERDILQRVVGEGRDPARTFVAEVMTRSPYTVNVDTTIDAVKNLVTSTHCRHLPVHGPRGIAGLISSGDLTAWDLRSLRDEITEMTAYIHGPFSTLGFTSLDSSV